jgi:hypothetical protein
MKYTDWKTSAMPREDLHSEYPTDAQIEEMWAAYRLSGREGIVAFLRKRTREWQVAERSADSNQSGPAIPARANH